MVQRTSSTDNSVPVSGAGMIDNLACRFSCFCFQNASHIMTMNCFGNVVVLLDNVLQGSVHDSNLRFWKINWTHKEDNIKNFDLPVFAARFYA